MVPTPQPHPRDDCKDPSLQGGDGDVAPAEPAKRITRNQWSQPSGEQDGQQVGIGEPNI